MKTPWTKGTYFYEIQILMVVLQWQHSPLPIVEYSPKRGFWLGKFHCWRDTAWLYHGFGWKLNKFWRVFKSPFLMVWTFVSSLYAFLSLSFAGFHISYSCSDDLGTEMYRFWWKDRIINDMADIDHVDGHWNTMHNGHSERLGRNGY